MRTRINGRGVERGRLGAAWRIVGCGLAALLLAAAGTASAQTTSEPDSLLSTLPAEQVQDSTGSFSTRIPLQVPPFHGIEPKLALVYDSGQGNGFLGVGWRLDGLSVIQRASPRRGVPSFGSSDIYLLDGDEMVACGTGVTSPSCSAGGTHATKVESFLRIKQVGSPNSWEVTARDGTKLTYLPVSSWCTTNNSNEANNYRWALGTVVDTHGNTVTYSYGCESSTPNLYIDTISYNGNSLKFYKETRPDTLTYATGANLQSSTYRLKSIDVKVGAQRVRAYKLAYGVGETARSRLVSVQTFGRDAAVDASGTVSGGTSLPAVALTVSATQTSFGVSSWGSWTASGNVNGNWWLRGDFNGDGKPDLAQLQGNCVLRLLLSTGTGFTNPGWSIASCGSYTTTEIHAADVNGDGKTDLVSDLGASNTHVFLSTGSGFTYQSWATSGGTLARWMEADLNGDGMADFVQAALSNGKVSTLTSTGSGFTGASRDMGVGTPTSTPIPGPSPTAANMIVADFNGDGRSDLMFAAHPYYDSGQAGNRWQLDHTNYVAYVSLSDSTGKLGSASSWSSFGGGWASTQDGSGTWTDSVMVWMAGDINGDGVSDLANVHAHAASGSNLDVDVLIAKGNGFVRQTWESGTWNTTWLDDRGWFVGDITGDGRADVVHVNTNNGTASADVLESTGTDFTKRNWGSWSNIGNFGAAGDFNGDGRTDVAMMVKNASGQWWPNNVLSPGGSYPDLLTGVKNSLGGTTTVAYKGSPAWTGNVIPFVLQTVASITRNDGRTAAATTSYSYTGGLWNWAERRFLGFRTRTATMPCIAGESSCPKRISTFVQSIAAYRPLEQYEEQDGSGTTLRKRVEEWTLTTASLPYKALNTASWSYLYAGGSSKRTKVTRTFDSYGNVTQQTEWGYFDASGDERTTQTDYAANTTAYIVGLPGRVQVFAGSTTGGAKLAETQTLYDNAAAYTTAPTKGDATASRVWLNTTGGYLVSTASYDSYGNRSSATTPLGAVTQYFYDATYHVFLTETRDPLYASNSSHKTTTNWDVVCTQPSQTTDLNSLATTYQYDALCRPTRTDTPGGGFAITSYNSIGTPTAQYVETQTPPANGTGNLWKRSYLDGFARTYRSAAKGPSGTQDIRVDTAYDARGNVASETAPYYASDAAYTTIFSYDGIDRRTQRKHPDNSTVQGAYGLGTGNAIAKLTVTDELGRATTTHTDAYGNTVRREQPLGASPVITTYLYDLLNRLAGLTDDAGNAWSYSYDSASRRLVSNDPDLGSWSYQYDDSGRLVLQTDALGQKTRMTYDGLDRVLTRTARADTVQAEVTSFTYDELRTGFYNVGQLTTATNPYATIQTSFDKEGRLASKAYVVDGTTYPFAIGYDTGGRVLWQSYPDGDSVGSAASPMLYDAAGRLNAVPGVITATAYDARGNPTNVTRANGVGSVLGYSLPRGWLTSLTTTVGATTLQDLSYARDMHGRINGVTSSQPGESWSYGYDDMDRLLTATNITDSLLTQSFAYDRVGNMTSNSAIGAYTYPAPSSPRPHAVTATPLGSYGYDANGNMIAEVGDSLTYDGQNRLTVVNAVTFAYGPDGARLKKTAPGSTTLYLGDDVEITGGLMTKYLPGNAKRVGSATYWLHQDHLNSVRVATDLTGAIVYRANYRPYGEKLAGVTLISESKAFIGERQDDETGLIYLHARYYDPELGRLTQADSSSPSDPVVGIDRYAYALNNPIALADPSGLKPQEDGYDQQAHGCQGTCSAGEHDFEGNAETRRDPGYNDSLTTVRVTASGRLIVTSCDGAGCHSEEIQPAVGEEELPADFDITKYKTLATRKIHSKGEIELLKNAPSSGLPVNLAEVTLYSKEGLPYAGVTIGNDVYIKSSLYSEDYSVSGTAFARAVFLHEYTHVWQGAQGMNPHMLPRSAYFYDLTPTTPFMSLNTEQQAAVVQDYYTLRTQSFTQYGVGIALSTYKAVLAQVGVE
jgi:RHS repeat-associated protein